MTDVNDSAVSAPQEGVPIIRTFQGANMTDQRRNPWSPDCNGAVNNTYFVELINQVFSVYDKQTGELVTRVTDTQFWIAAGITSPAPVDPRIVFIPNAGQGGQWLA